MSDSEKPKSSWWDCMKTIEHKWHAPIVSIEWVCWRISPFLKQLSFLEVLEYLSRLAVLVAVIFYIWEFEDRQKAKHYQAWQVINLAQGKLGSAGRMDALQDLNKDKVSLVGVDISKAYLHELNLEDADLFGANLSKTDLAGANLSGASLTVADLSGAHFYEADLSGASLFDANLPGAILTSANLSETNLRGANLSGASLHDANLSGAHFYEADLSEAYLRNSNLRSIKHWQKIKSVKYANIFGVVNPPDGFIEWAKEHGAVSIENREEWKKFISEKRQEKTQQKQ